MTGSRIRLLIVEDHDSYRRILRRMLEAEGLEVVGEAGDGCAAIVAARHYAPDVILSDYHMPIMDGIAMARLIKAGPQPPPIILLSSETWGLIDRARTVGIDQVLEKGCTITSICAAIHQAARQAPPKSTPWAA
ncbi:MAG: response regulator [Chloroflexales bacterium]|nr:response regulator [Chloroflexales bacterium]